MALTEILLLFGRWGIFSHDNSREHCVWVIWLSHRSDCASGAAPAPGAVRTVCFRRGLGKPATPTRSADRGADGPMQRTLAPIALPPQPGALEVQHSKVLTNASVNTCNVQQ